MEEKAAVKVAGWRSLTVVEEGQEEGKEQAKTLKRRVMCFLHYS